MPFLTPKKTKTFCLPNNPPALSAYGHGGLGPSSLKFSISALSPTHF